MESSAATQTETGLGTTPIAAAPRSENTRARRRSTLLARWLLLADLAAATIAGAAVVLLPSVEASQALVITITASALWPVLCFAVGLYVRDDLRFWASGVAEASRTLVAALLFGWAILGVAFVSEVSAPGAVTLLVVTGTATLCGIGRSAVRGGIHRLPELRQSVAILGSGVVAGQLADKLRRNDQFGLTVVGLVDDDVHPVGDRGLPLLGSLGDLADVLEEHRIDRVIIAFSRASHEQLLGSIRVCQDAGVAVDVVPRLFELLGGVRSLDQVGGLPILSIGAPRLSRSSRFAKRVLDIVLSATALLLLAPLLLVLAIAVRLESPGPAFFRQSRVGRDGKAFQLLKLRSMYADADRGKHELVPLNDITDGVLFKIRRDPRITRLGRLLRRFSLDELPQLLNVLKGDMSLVGPRPLIRPESDAMAESWHLRRLELRPGLTGPWQIYGRSETPFQEMVSLDYQYVAGWALARDLEILLATLPAVLSGRGAY